MNWSAAPSWEGARAVGPATRRFSRMGSAAAVAWLAAAAVTIGLPDLYDWDSTRAVATTEAVGGLALLIAAATARADRGFSRLRSWEPWILALGLLLLGWELVTAKLGWLPRPFFAPPQGIVDVYVDDGARLLECVLRSLFLFLSGYAIGVSGGILAGLAIGWSPLAAYWGRPLLKLIGPVPANAWLPIVLFVFPTTFSGSVFLVALASGVPVTILTWSGVASVDRALYDVARTHGADNRFLVRHVALPAALPHVFVGLFMGLYSSFAVLVVAELLGVKAGLGWYLQWATGWAAYANVDAALLVMAFVCSGLVKLLFLVRDRLLAWQKGLVRW
jgi:NitT/TauT family transport system permease protein